MVLSGVVPGLVVAGLGLGSYLSARSRQKKLAPAPGEDPRTAYNRRQERYSIVIMIFGLAGAAYGLAGGFDP